MGAEINLEACMLEKPPGIRGANSLGYSITSGTARQITWYQALGVVRLVTRTGGIVWVPLSNVSSMGEPANDNVQPGFTPGEAVDYDAIRAKRDAALKSKAVEEKAAEVVTTAVKKASRAASKARAKFEQAQRDAGTPPSE